MERCYEVGHTYIDRGGQSFPEDQLLRWLNIPGSGIPNTPGIRHMKYVNDRRFRLPAFVVLITHEKRRRSANPWEDVVDLNTSTVYYWGDAKFDQSKGYRDFGGNKVLEAINAELLNPDRTHIPPILHFSKPAPGRAVFTGLCVLSRLELTWFVDDDLRPVQNYRAHLTILDTASVPVSWLHDRALAVDKTQMDQSAPDAWMAYLSGNIKPRDIWVPQLRDRGAQLPQEGSADQSCLLQLCSLDPIVFESAAVSLIRRLPNVHHSIHQTRPTADGGFDFYGHFTLPRPMTYEINVRGQVKRYAPRTAVGPGDVSRLVARLGRGEYGMFMTTSYYTRAAQREVLEDAYPVALFAGVDLIRIMKEVGLIQRDHIDQAWLGSLQGPTAS
jgi:hypothetical protein